MTEMRIILSGVSLSACGGVFRALFGTSSSSKSEPNSTEAPSQQATAPPAKPKVTAPPYVAAGCDSLSWSRCRMGQGFSNSECSGKPQSKTWQEANDFCQNIDQRLPTREEVMDLLGNCDSMLLDFKPKGKCTKCFYSDKCRAIYPDQKEYNEGMFYPTVWTSTEDKYEPNKAWKAQMGMGEFRVSNKTSKGNFYCVEDVPANSIATCDESVPTFASNNPAVPEPGSSRKWLRCPLGQSWDGTQCTGEMLKVNFINSQTQPLCPEGFRVPKISEFVNLLGDCEDFIANMKNMSRNGGGCEKCVRSDKCREVFGADENVSYWINKSNADTFGRVWVVNAHRGWIQRENHEDPKPVRCVSE